jgi:hypothetical protein
LLIDKADAQARSPRGVKFPDCIRLAGGKANPKTANWLMRWRIIFQFIAVALFAILLLLLKS